MEPCLSNSKTLILTVFTRNMTRFHHTWGKAFVAIEDERFYKHNGIDIQGIIRAGVNGVAHGFHFTEGASTLTQQLIKNNVFPNFINESKYQRIERKIQEQYLALKIEKRR